MTCPQCQAEYRQGFTRCADCDVDLVPSPAETERGVATARSSGKLAPLWEGEDLGLHTTLLEQLESAGIRYFDEAMGVYPGARRGDPFPIQPMTRFGYQVAVLSSDLEAARGIVEKLLEEDRGILELPESEREETATTEQSNGTDEKAICEVRAGQNEGGMSFLHDALRENNTVTRTENTEAGTKIYVRPRDERLAREIVREIVEGAPPE
jgi:hypothetical protein